ncbi:MAG TPA: glycoside hydrolase family 3 N-terminal domain-containing protein [Acidimicrobiia bacterium]|nr:glycoside hydrolase family 3 N-terminal domain-containing protein [Acidimicrobiia bacterium]
MDSENHPYRDPELTVDERVDDLLARMTLDEKLAQLGSAWAFQLMSGSQHSAERAEPLTRHGLGQVTRIAGATSLTADAVAGIANQIQRRLVEETRLGIPAIVHEEICSGLMGRGATVFPQAIGIASTFEPGLNEEIAGAIRVQMRRAGAHQGLSPVLDVTRDPRWGRTEETYGEDPYLVSRMGNAFVRGLQGEDLSTGVIATAKHFVGYGASEGGMNWAPAHLGEREIREVFLHPFETAVVEAGLRSVMNSYNELDGVPGGANEELIDGLLRKTWGFEGTVVSDYFAVDQLAVYHRLASDKTQAASLALRSGIDVELPSTDCYGEPLAEAVNGGHVEMAAIDDAVRRALRLKFELGIFESPYVDPGLALESVGTEEHRELASRAARMSMVLLKNDGALPLDPAVGRIAVIGPNADVARHMFGDYSYPAHIESLLEVRDQHNVFDVPIPMDVPFEPVEVEAPTILDVLRSRFGDRVTYARGCGTSDGDMSEIARAAEIAAEADVVVLVVGDKAGLTIDCTSGEGRDRSSLDLPGVQEQLARAVIEMGTPVITVLVVGRPCGSEYLHDRSSAVLLAWLPGQEGSAAIADVLDGAFNPGGKLPITFPRSVGQLPVFYGHKVSGGRSHWQGDYVDGPTTPLYPFGFGIGYADFELTDAVVETPSIGEGENARVSVAVTNTGDVTGDEVVQVYSRDEEASVTRPVLELKAFARISLEAGESKLVRFDLPVGQLGFYDKHLDYVVEDGEIEIFVGRSSDDVVSAGHVLIKAVGPIEKAFGGSWQVETGGPPRPDHH